MNNRITLLFIDKVVLDWTGNNKKSKNTRPNYLVNISQHKSSRAMRHLMQSNGSSLASLRFFLSYLDDDSNPFVYEFPISQLLET
jgi:hypothetical protein